MALFTEISDNESISIRQKGAVKMSRPFMSKRENLLRALRRQNPDHVPFALSFCPKLAAEFRDRYGVDDYETWYGFPFRHVSIGPSARTIDYTPWHPHLPGNA